MHAGIIPAACACLAAKMPQTLLLFLYFQLLLTFYCNLFSFYPLLLKNNNEFCPNNKPAPLMSKIPFGRGLFLPVKGAQAQHTRMFCGAHPIFQSYIFLSVAFPFQCRATTVSHQQDPIPACMWCVF